MACFLVVDDEANTAFALRSLLQDDGHEAEAYTSAGDAVEALARRSFDAVLVDLELPHLGGDAVVRAVRRYQPAACIVVSASRAEWSALENACHFFEKPLDYGRFATTVVQCRANGGPGLHGDCHRRRGQ